MIQRKGPTSTVGGTKRRQVDLNKEFRFRKAFNQAISNRVETVHFIGQLKYEKRAEIQKSRKEVSIFIMLWTHHIVTNFQHSQQIPKALKNKSSIDKGKQILQEGRRSFSQINPECRWRVPRAAGSRTCRWVPNVPSPRHCCTQYATCTFRGLITGSRRNLVHGIERISTTTGKTAELNDPPADQAEHDGQIEAECRANARSIFSVKLQENERRLFAQHLSRIFSGRNPLSW